MTKRRSLFDLLRDAYAHVREHGVEKTIRELTQDFSPEDAPELFKWFCIECSPDWGAKPYAAFDGPCVMDEDRPPDLQKCDGCGITLKCRLWRLPYV